MYTECSCDSRRRQILIQLSRGILVISLLSRSKFRCHVVKLEISLLSHMMSGTFVRHHVMSGKGSAPHATIVYKTTVKHFNWELCSLSSLARIKVARYHLFHVNFNARFNFPSILPPSLQCLATVPDPGVVCSQCDQLLSCQSEYEQRKPLRSPKGGGRYIYGYKCGRVMDVKLD